MIRCPTLNCNAIGRVEIVNGEKEFLCDVCSNLWFPAPEAIPLYQEYLVLKSKTHIPVADVRRNYNQPYNITIIHPEDLHRRKELAVILNEKYQPYLDINASEWFEVNKDARF